MPCLMRCLLHAYDLTPELRALAEISAYIDKTDKEMRAYRMSLDDGKIAQVVLWNQGDTTSGVIIRGLKLLGEIEEIEIRLPSSFSGRPLLPDTVHET